MGNHWCTARKEIRYGKHDDHTPEYKDMYSNPEPDYRYESNFSKAQGLRTKSVTTGSFFLVNHKMIQIG